MCKYGFPIPRSSRGNEAQIKSPSATPSASAHFPRLARLLALLLCLLPASHLAAQTGSDLDLSTRCVGVPPTHTTVDSVARWMENPLDQKLQVCVSNFYAAATDCLEISVGPQHLKFYGAGMDDTGHYLPTNYAPVTVKVVLRREYAVNVTCPNSGPIGSPFFKSEDFSDPDTCINNLTNSTVAPLLAAFVWTNLVHRGGLVLT